MPKGELLKEKRMKNRLIKFCTHLRFLKRFVLTFLKFRLIKEKMETILSWNK